MTRGIFLKKDDNFRPSRFEKKQVPDMSGNHDCKEKLINQFARTQATFARVRAKTFRLGFHVHISRA